MNNTSLDNIRRYITPFFNWCYENDYIDKSPFRGMNRIKQEQKLHVILTEEEIELLKENCITYRERALIEFLCATGVRVSELRKLKIDDINFIDGEVIIYGEKTKSWRLVYLCEDVLEYLKLYLEKRPYDSEYVFCSAREPHGIPCVQTIEKEIHIIANRAKIEKNCTVHTFRKTLATRLYKNGMDMKCIAKLLGHSVTVLEKFYLSLNDEYIKHKYLKYINLNIEEDEEIEDR